MKKLLSLTILLLAVTLQADEIKRDANGKIISTTTRNPGGAETVRDPNGKILEQKSAPAPTGTVTVRDPNGKIIRTETRR